MEHAGKTGGWTRTRVSGQLVWTSKPACISQRLKADGRGISPVTAAGRVPMNQHPRDLLQPSQKSDETGVTSGFSFPISGYR